MQDVSVLYSRFRNHCAKLDGHCYPVSTQEESQPPALLEPGGAYRPSTVCLFANCLQQIKI